MGAPPDPDWYFENVLAGASPDDSGRRRFGPAEQWHAWWQRLVVASEPLTTAARQGFVLGTPDLAALGVTRAYARSAVRRSQWTAPAFGVVSPIDVRGVGDTPLVVARRRHALLAAAGSLRHPSSVISGRSAAILHGAPTLAVPRLAELTSAGDAGLGLSSVHTFGAALGARSVTSWFGLPVTDVARTVTDLARHDRRDGLMACDAALREHLVDRRLLDAALEEAIGWPGVRQARTVVALASPLAESPLESLTRLALHDSGFPTPELQVEIAGYRVDFLLVAARLVIEADGRVKYSADELWREKQREHALRGAGFAVERVIWADVMRGWPVTERRLRAALATSRPPSPSAWS